MEVIVVTRTYNNYEDSYTKTLGVVTSDSQANELIEKDKHKDDALGMTVTEYNNQLYAINERFNKLAINEEACPKKAGWLYRYDYNQLTKQQKIAYDIIKAGWEELGKPSFRYFKEVLITYNSDYRYYMQILLGFKRSTIEEVKNMSRTFHNREDPEHITYRKEKFIVEANKIEFPKDRVQSQVEWSEEDEKLFNRICDLIHEAAYENCETNEDGKELGEYAKMVHLLKFLKDCIQPKQEWSEEDEWKFSDILALLRGGENCHYNTPELFDWLKSLKNYLNKVVQPR